MDASAEWFQAHGVQVPPGPEAIRPILARNGDPDEQLRSPRDGKPFVIRWGAQLPTQDPPYVWIYEEVGEGGRRFVGLSDMSVREMDENEFRAAPLAPLSRSRR